jgi:hypothetical protein
MWAGYRDKRYSDFFQPKYLDYRLDIFKNVTLKSFQEQSDKDFVVFLLHSTDLPQKYKDIFQSLEESNHFLHNIFFTDAEARSNTDVITEQIIDSLNCDDVLISFRIDNDDALPCDYISRLRNYLKPEFTGHVLTIPKIQIIQRTNKNKYIIKGKFHTFTSMGMAYVCNKENFETIMHLGAHNELYLNYPMILLSEIGGLQTINGRNAANMMPIGRVSQYNDDSLKSFLSKNNYPDMDLKCLHIYKRNVFSSFLKIIIEKLNKWNSK